MTCASTRTHLPALPRAHACSPPASLPRSGGSLGLRPAARARDRATETRRAGPTPLSWAAVSPGRCWGTSFVGQGVGVGAGPRREVGACSSHRRFESHGGFTASGATTPAHRLVKEAPVGPWQAAAFLPPCPHHPPPLSRPWKLDLGGPGKEPVLPTCQFWRILSRAGTSEDG